MEQDGMLSCRRRPPTVEEESGDELSRERNSMSLWTGPFSTISRYLGWGQLVALAVTVFIVVSLLYVAFEAGFSRVTLQGDDQWRMSLREHGQKKEGFGFDFGSLGVPWCRTKNGRTVEWTKEDLIKALKDFVPIYDARPIRKNGGGMLFDHSFGLWFVARWLQPKLIIESGAFKGHSTWVLRQAMPSIPIISLSPTHPREYRPAYVDQHCTYLSGKDFVDFGSVDWRPLLEKHGVSDPSRVLVLFDDHQHELKRIKQALKVGFQHVIFDDNYDTGLGDHYSARQMCDQFYVKGGGHCCISDSDEAIIRSHRRNNWTSAVDIKQLCGDGEAWWGIRGKMLDNFGRSEEKISYEEHMQNGRYLESVLDIYWEVPPIAGPSLTHQHRYDPARTTTPIVEDGRLDLFQTIGLSKLEEFTFNGYNQMTYLQISAPTT